jgi:single-stranded-DNA-specific exonuclease
VGVAYKLAQALATRFPGRLDPNTVLDLVALGTVADVVPLRDENRSLVQQGLMRLRATSRVGLLALFRAAGIEASRIDPTAIGFYLAPRINAANRVATPHAAYDLITAVDEEVAVELASQLDGLNTQRQALVTETFELVAAGLGAPETIVEEARGGSRPPVLIVLGDWPAGISGLLANRLVEVYGLPAFVGTEGEGGIVSISARGTRTVAIDLLIETCEASQPGGLFLGYGGHAHAGGFRIPPERLDIARALLEDQARLQVPLDQIGSVLSVDAEVRLAQLDLNAARIVRTLAPFGVEFTEPLFMSRDVEVREIRPIGNGTHARLTVQQGTARRSAVAFGAPAELMALRPGARLDIVFNLQIDEWEGMQRVQLCIRDWAVRSY